MKFRTWALIGYGTTPFSPNHLSYISKYFPLSISSISAWLMKSRHLESFSDTMHE